MHELQRQVRKAVEPARTAGVLPAPGAVQRAPVSMGPHAMLALQAAAGNRAVAQLLSRSCDCGSPDCCGESKGDAPTTGGGDARPQVEALAAAAAASQSPGQLLALADQMDAALDAAAAPDSSSQPGTVAKLARIPAGGQAQRVAERTSGQRGGIGAFCQPYEWYELGDAARDKAFLISTLPAVSTGMFGTTEVGAIWLQFLTGGAPARRSYATAGNPIVEGFSKSGVTAEEHGFVLDEVERGIASSPPTVPATGEVEISVTAFPGVNADRTIDWSNPFDIPGHLAGGQSGGAGGADTRTLEGSVFLSRVAAADGTSAIRMRSNIGFVVNDTVDFCPGGAGSGLEQALTVPLSRLEATGPFWASDVPIDVRFKPPSTTRVIATGAAPPETSSERSSGEVRSRGGDRSRGREDGVRREDQDTQRVD